MIATIDALMRDPLAMVAVQSTVLMSLAILIASAFPKRAAVRSSIHLVALVCSLVGPISLLICSLTGLTASIAMKETTALETTALDTTALGNVGSGNEPGGVGVAASRVPSIEPMSLTELEGPTVPSTKPTREATTPEAELVVSFRSCLLSIWIGGSLVYGLGLTVSLIRIRSLLRKVKPMDDPFQSAIQRAASDLGVTKYPRLGVSDRITSPVAVGLPRNAWVLLPQRCLNRISDEQLVHVLIHEGAHVIHRDPLIRLLQRVSLVIWWWNPLTHILNCQLSRAREEACDNRVLMRVDGEAYGTTLLELGKLIPRESDLVTSVGFFGSRWSLEHRIEGILNPGRDLMIRISKAGWLLVLSVFFSVTLLTSVTRLAAQETQKPLPTAEPTSSLQSVDVFIAIETRKEQQTILITAREKIEFKTLNAVLKAFPGAEENNIFLTVAPEDAALHAPRTTGDQHIGIKLTADPIEVYVTDRMPYKVTSNICTALDETGLWKGVTLKSTHRLAEQFKKEQQAKQPEGMVDDPFGM